LREIEGRQANERAHELGDAFQAAFIGHFAAQRLEFLVEHVLAADRRGFVRIARPQLEGVLAAKPDVEAALDVALLGVAEAGELAQLGDRQRRSVDLGHGPALPRPPASRHTTPQHG
jgi:hypothetical protein